MERADVQPYRLRLPREEYEALRAISFATGTSINELIHRAVREYLSDEGRREQVRALMEGAIAQYQVALDKLADL